MITIVLCTLGLVFGFWITIETLAYLFDKIKAAIIRRRIIAEEAQTRQRLIACNRRQMSQVLK